MVKRVLKERVERATGIFAPDVDQSDALLRLTTDYETQFELLDKVQILEKFPADDQIAIGNSLTDLRMAEKAQMVFARDRLSRYLDERSLPYTPWKDFFEVREILENRWHDAHSGTAEHENAH